MTRDDALYWLNADTTTLVALRLHLRALLYGQTLLAPTDWGDERFLRGVEAGMRTVLISVFDVKPQELRPVLGNSEREVAIPLSGRSIKVKLPRLIIHEQGGKIVVPWPSDMPHEKYPEPVMQTRDCLKAWVDDFKNDGVTRKTVLRYGR